MKKNFLKIALLSVIACGMPATFTSCDDDGWKSRCDTLEVKSDDAAKLIEQLSNQVKTLETQIAQNKQDAATAQKAADAAMAAAQAAQKAGDDAMAAAKTADAAAKAAAAAAAEAKAEAAAALKAQYEELIALINANKAELAAQKALIEGNAALIAQYKNLIDGNTVKINDNAGAIAKILEELKKYATSDQLAAQDEALKALIDALDKKLEAAGTNAQTAIEGLNNSVAGLQTALEVLNGKSEALGVQVSDLKKQVTESLGTLEANLTAQIAAEAALRAQGDKALQDQIDALKKDLAALNIASNLESFTKFISETETQLAALKKYDEALEKKIGQNAAGIEAANKLIADNKAKIAALEATLNATKALAEANAANITKQAALIQANAQAIAKNAGEITKLQDAIAKLNNETIADLQGQINAFDAQLFLVGEKLDGIINDLSNITPYIITMTMEQLRGLVFIPETFVGGIESALSYNLQYYAQTAVAGTTDAFSYTSPNNGLTFKVANYKTWNLAVANNAVEQNFHPATVISYHMNPTSALVEFKDLNIVSNDAEILSRAAKAGIELDATYNENKGLSIADGVLSVAINGDASLYENSTKMPVFALQAKVYSEEKEDENGEAKTVVTTVTSDYAMFAQMNVRPDAISINKKAFNAQFGVAQGRGNKEVYQINENNATTKAAMAEALENVAVVNVPWNGTADLLDFMQINYTDIQRNNPGVWTSAEDWSKFNLKMTFSLIDYTVADNKVSESSWASIDAETGVITPCVNGNAAVQSTDELGHMPLVRVVVTEGNNVVLQGFIRIQIVPSVEDYSVETLTYNNVDFSCETVNTGYQTNATNVFNMMLAATGLSKDVFLAHYSPVSTKEYENIPGFGDIVSKEVMTQFVKIQEGYSELAQVGEILLTSLDGQHDVPDPADDSYNGNAPENYPEYLFDWYLDTYAQQVVYEQSNKHSYTTYICFAGDSEMFPHVYIPVSVAVNQKPVASVGTKMEARWFRNLTTGLLNVQQPTNGFQPTTIVTDLDLLWQGSKPTFTQTAGSPANYFKNNAAMFAQENNVAGGYKYYFPAEQPQIDGITYTVASKTNPCLTGDKSLANSAMGNHALMVVKNGAFVTNGEYNNTVLKANGQELATINPTTGEITLSQNADAYKLLNKYPSDGDGLNRTNAKLMVNVAVVAYNECGVALQLSENVIPAVFLRPINIVEADKILDFTDAVANGSKVPVYSLLDFSDWRSVAFAGQEWLFAYYNVKSVKVNLDKMTTNAGTINSNPNKFVVDQSVIAAFSIEGQATGNIDYTGLINSGSNSAVKAKVSAAFGNIVYDNTKLNVKAFDVIIPMTINYGLGSFDVNVKCHVKATL